MLTIGSALPTTTGAGCWRMWSDCALSSEPTRRIDLDVDFSGITASPVIAVSTMRTSPEVAETPGE